MDTPILAQSNPSATTLTTAYIVGLAKIAVLSSIIVCNRSGNARTYRIALSPGGVADDPSHYIAYDSTIDANKTVTFVLGITLEEDDEVRVYDSAADLTFTICGVENDTGS